LAWLGNDESPATAATQARENAPRRWRQSDSCCGKQLFLGALAPIYASISGSFVLVHHCLTLELFFHDTQKPLSLSSVHYLPNPEVEENSAATRRIVLSFDSSLPSSTFSLVYATMAGMNNAQ